MISVTAAGLEALLASLTRAQTQAPLATRATVAANAKDIQQAWRRRWGGIKPGSLAASITFDITRGLGSVKAEIGPDKQIGAGPLGNLIEFGSSKNAPIPGGLPAAEAQEPKFERALGELGEKLLD